MELVNLKKYYPCLYAKDTLIEVSDEVAEALLIMQRQENASIRRHYYHRAFFSLDCEDGIENDRIGEIAPSPEEICIQRETRGAATRGTMGCRRRSSAISMPGMYWV